MPFYFLILLKKKKLKPLISIIIFEFPTWLNPSCHPRLTGRVAFDVTLWRRGQGRVPDFVERGSSHACGVPTGGKHF